MINGRVAILRIITCAIGGIIFFMVLHQFFPFNWRYYEHGVHYSGAFSGIGPHFPPILAVIGIGALFGLLPGIAWAIDQKSARRRFLLWSIFGIVIGFVAATLTNRAAPMIAFCVAGVYIGGVSALNRLGVFKDKSESE